MEWNVFMMFSVLALFVGHAGLGLGDLQSPLPIVLFVVVAGTVVIGNLFPRKVSFLPGMRYYAGNWDTGLWCVKPSAEHKIAKAIIQVRTGKWLSSMIVFMVAVNWPSQPRHL